MPKKETKILGGSASRCGGRRVLVVKCGVGARKDTERMWDHQMWWWSSLPTSLVCKSQLIRKRNPSGNNQFITTVTGENTSLSHNSRGAIHIPGVVLQGAHLHASRVNDASGATVEPLPRIIWIL